MEFHAIPHQAESEPTPLISVILNYYDPRGLVENVATWTRNQTLPEDQYEVIVVTTANRAHLETEIRKHLRPQDRLLRTEKNGAFEVYAPAVALARAPLLFLSEDHCVAEPDCLEIALRFMNQHEWAGASFIGGHINHNDIGRMEQRTCERDLAIWSGENHWDKVRIRGVVLTRQAYDSVGGLDGRYHHFAEPLLAARLHATGQVVSFISEKGINHINTTHFSELYAHAWEYSWNECEFCESEDPAFSAYYFNSALSYLRENLCDRATRSWLTTALWRFLRQRGRLFGWRSLTEAETRSLLKAWALAAWNEVLGDTGRRMRAFQRLWSARLRYYWWRFSEERRYRAFEDYWMRIVDCTRADFVAARNRSGQVKRPRLKGLPEGIKAIDAVGLHAVEQYQDASFCWTKPAASFWFDVQAGDYSVTLDTLSLRDPACAFPFVLYWNEQPITDAVIQRGQGRITFQVKREQFVADANQRLTVVSVPLKTPAVETRWLGIPLSSISFTAEKTSSSGEQDSAAAPRLKPAAQAYGASR